MRFVPRFILIFLVFGLPAFSQSYRGNSAALADDVRVVVWYDRESFPSTDFSQAWQGDSGVDSESNDQPPVVQALELAREFTSGMIYGYEFSYVPPDAARQIEESFSLTPLHSIEWGDPAMSLESFRDFESWVQLTFRYRLDDDQSLLRRRWLGVQFQNSRGLGESPLYLNYEGQIQAFEQAFLQAVRAYARGISHDKPAEILGRGVLTDPPRLWSASGNFVADVKIQLVIDDLRFYSVF